jgi:hypothetical protein
MNYISDLWQANGQEPHQTPGPAPQSPVPPAARPPFDPLSEGAHIAMQQARKNIGIQRPHPMRPVVELLGNMGTAQLRGSKTLAGQALGKQGFNPYAVQDLENEQNMALMQELQKAEQARRIHEIQKQTLEETKRHHLQTELKGNRLNKEQLIDSDINSLQQIVPGAIPLSALTIGERTSVAKEMRERANLPYKMAPVMDTLEKMVKISEQYPELGMSYSAALFPDQYKSGLFGWTDPLRKASMNRKKLAAIEKFEKLSSELVLHKVHALGSQRANMFLERLMKAAAGHYGLTPEAMRAIYNQNAEEYARSKQDSKIMKQGISGIKAGNRVIPFYKPQDVEEEEMQRHSELKEEPEVQQNLNRQPPIAAPQAQRVEITNQKTGEKKLVTLEEAKQLGAKIP